MSVRRPRSMPLFGKSKKAQDGKKQEAAPASKPAAYRHVPKHAASDARNHGLAESDRAAQQQRIMAASQSRLNSMNSNYSVKSNFDDVPIKGSVFTASNSARQSIGNAAGGKDRAAVQPGSPAGPTQPPHKGQQDYVKLRNPSLLSNVTFPTNSTPKPTLAVKNPTIAGGVASSDSGYGSVGRISRPDSTISKATTEARQSQDAKSGLRTSSGYDFLPKLDFTPESSRPPTSSDQITPPISPAKPASIIASRDRAVSNSSSYISRLDPGSDRRSVASSQFKPFDQIDFSKPGPQLIPQSPRPKIWSDGPDPLVVGRSESPTLPLQPPARPLSREPKAEWTPRAFTPTEPSAATSPSLRTESKRDIAATSPPEPRKEWAPRAYTPTERTIGTAAPAPPESKGEAAASSSSEPKKEWVPRAHTPTERLNEEGRSSQTKSKIEADPRSAQPAASSKGPSRTPAEESHHSAGILFPPSEQQIVDQPSLQLTDDQRINATADQNALPVMQDERSFPAEKMQTESTLPQPVDPTGDEPERRTPRPVATPSPPVEQPRRESSSSRTTQQDHTKAQNTRHRNWSRPSQSSGSQLDSDRKSSNTIISASSARPPALFSREKDHSNGTSETELDTNEANRSEPAPSSLRSAQAEYAPQPQMPQKWNDQTSSIYGDSTYNPSTRQHSPSRRGSFAPSELLDHGQPNGKLMLPPLSILDGLKVNKRGKILDEEGDPIGELVEGDIIDCVRQKANAFGQVLDDYGRVVGRVVTTNRGAGAGPNSTAASTRSRTFTDYHPDPMQRYALPESQLISPATPTLARPFEYLQEEDARQRAASLQAAAARRNPHGQDAHIELDGSGAAEAAPLVDHSEIFAPPFIPSRSPKRSPAEPATQTMDYYFAKPAETAQPPPEEAPRLKKWASRNLEQDREEMQTPRQAPPMPPTQPPSEHTISRPSTRGETPSEQQSTIAPSETDTAAQSFISSDQPKDIFPWMNSSTPREQGKWNNAIFNYKGDSSGEDAKGQPAAPSVRSNGVPRQNQSAFASPQGPPKQYIPHAALTAGSRKSNRNSHQPHVKSPLSTNSACIIPDATPRDRSVSANPQS